MNFAGVVWLAVEGIVKYTCVPLLLLFSPEMELDFGIS